MSVGWRWAAVSLGPGMSDNDCFHHAVKLLCGPVYALPQQRAPLNQLGRKPLPRASDNPLRLSDLHLPERCLITRPVFRPLGGLLDSFSLDLPSHHFCLVVFHPPILSCAWPSIPMLYPELKPVSLSSTAKSPCNGPYIHLLYYI